MEQEDTRASRLWDICSLTKTRHHGPQKDAAVSLGLKGGERSKFEQFPKSGNSRAGLSPQARDQGGDF